MAVENNISMYYPEKDHTHSIKICYDGSISQVINLESFVDEDKAYFIKKFVNASYNSALILSNENMLNELKYPEWERVTPGIKNLSVHNEDIEKLSFPKGRETTNIGINIDLFKENEIHNLLAKVHHLGRKGNSVLLIIDNLNYLLNIKGLNKEPYARRTIENTLYYTPTLICDGFPLDQDLFKRIKGITTTIRNVSEDSYDVIYNKHNEVFEDIKLENINLTPKHRDY
ncbi:hypothetical protein MettiDRAFT_2770 [Methanolobus tindarius DSM 2278]|uniref:Uncharacterized protein n=1 Tax=Methanolobus tindarius DSM 2278 TaxID=1090322 RepID=W9DUG5_METTI|nr:hypothetical protein [Methanolobus tindarius]ETA69275.1 hypothetical protein MettiDRAFT_2770 [Methanolobus tindarius DSM 2278]